MDESFPTCRTSRSIRLSAAVTGHASAPAAPASPPKASTATSASRVDLCKSIYTDPCNPWLQRLPRRECRCIPRAELFVPLRQRVTQEFVHLFNSGAIDRFELGEVLSMPSA